jgi:hypothetical protein
MVNIWAKFKQNRAISLAEKLWRTVMIKTDAGSLISV